MLTRKKQFPTHIYLVHRQEPIFLRTFEVLWSSEDATGVTSRNDEEEREGSDEWMGDDEERELGWRWPTPSAD